MGAGSGGVGYGKGGDDSNNGPRGKIGDVEDLSKVSTQVGQSGTVFSLGEIKGAPSETAPASVPYTEVYSNYSKAAENALSKDKIPPAYRTRVKEYFSSLEPQKE